MLVISVNLLYGASRLSAVQISCSSIIFLVPEYLPSYKAFHSVVLIYSEGLLASHLARVDKPLINYMGTYSTIKPQYIVTIHRSLW
jgi:hypothetical protein